MTPAACFGTVHLDDEDRRRQLLGIESRMCEHPFPPQLVVENTSHCNLRCVHCAHKEMTRPRRHMARALWNKIVEEVGRRSPDTELCPTFYGEALILGDDLWDRLDDAARAGCRNLVLSSNGTLLGRRHHIDRILRSPLRRFILSLDGLSKDVFEKVRVNARWDEVYPAVEELCRRRLARGTPHPVIVAQFSVMKQNAHEVEAFAEYWRARGAEVEVRPLLEWTASGSIRTETIRHDSDFRIACPWGHSTMAIHQDGRVPACAVDYGGRFTAGNVKTESVADVWAKL
jgi:MoaA/NifB/PqqE/SkfB family radical SAM enzyme